MVGASTLQNLKMVLKQNLFKNCPITVKDVNFSEKIFGTDVSTLKGRSTRPRPPQIMDNTIEIPEELLRNNEEIDLAIDLIFINQVILLTAIDQTTRYRSTVPLDSREKKNYTEV